MIALGSVLGLFWSVLEWSEWRLRLYDIFSLKLESASGIQFGSLDFLGVLRGFCGIRGIFGIRYYKVGFLIKSWHNNSSLGGVVTCYWRIFWRIFDEFFWRIFWQIFWRIFWPIFFDEIFWMIFLTIFLTNIWAIFLRNFLEAFWDELFDKFWFFGRYFFTFNLLSTASCRIGVPSILFLPLILIQIS